MTHPYLDVVVIFRLLNCNYLGVQQSQGWVHYMIHEPEPHVLLFRRAIKG